MDYDSHKCATLSFFIEYLMIKGKPQKIRDLTCRYGDKVFTKEMRQIAGAGVAGLKKLLSAYPSLFTIIDDEYVCMNTYESTTSICYPNVASGIRKRDYMRETVNFFKGKLQEYGKDVMVPIVNLQGHLSQALPGIRLVTGASVADFKDFLSKYPETFRMIGEDVFLVACDEASASKSTATDSTATLRNLCENNCPKLCPVQLPDCPVVGNETYFLTRMPSSLNYFADDDAWKAKVLQHTQVISTVADSLLATKQILDVVAITGDQTVVSLHYKEAHLSDDVVRIVIIELGTTSGKALLFDVLTCPQIMIEGGLKALLENDRVIKVMHDCRYASGKLFKQFGTMLTNVFDTQSAYKILQHQADGTQINQTKDLSFYELVKLYYAPRSSVARFQWKRRPLAQETIIAAARDVLVLVDEQLYGSMALSIKPEYKLLLSELCTEQILTLIHPDEVKERKKVRTHSYEVAALKQKLAKTTQNVVLSNREMNHLKNIDLTVDDKGKLCGNRKLARKLEMLEGNGEDKSITASDGTTNATELDNTSLLSLLRGTNLSTVPEPSECVDAFPPKQSTNHYTKINSVFRDATMAFSLPVGDKSFAVDNTRDPEKRCCKHYPVDQASQTLSTGDIIIKRIYLGAMEQQAPK